MDNFVGSIHYFDLLCLVTRWPSVIETSQWTSALVAGRMPVDILVVFHGLYHRFGPLEKATFHFLPTDIIPTAQIVLKLVRLQSRRTATMTHHFSTVRASVLIRCDDQIHAQCSVFDVRYQNGYSSLSRVNMSYPISIISANKSRDLYDTIANWDSITVSF